MAGEPLSATWRLVTEPLQARPRPGSVDEGPARAFRRLALLDDVVFDGIVSQLASREEGAHLRALFALDDAAGSARALEARIAAVCSKRTRRLVVAARSPKPEARSLKPEA